MKRIVALLMTAVLFLCACTPAQPAPVSQEPQPDTQPPVQQEVSSKAPPIEQTPEGTELVDNGSFDTDITGWALYLEGGTAKLAPENGELKVEIFETGTKEHSVQIYQDISKVEEGCRYRMSLDMRSTVPCTVELRVQINGGDYHGYMLEKVAITTEMKNYTVEFTMQEPSDPAPRMAFNMGQFKTDPALGAHDLYFDNVSVVLADASGRVVAEESDAKMLPINLNQLGYRPQDEKLAIFSGEDTRFDVVEKATGTVAFSGEITGKVSDYASGQTVRYGDFTALTKEGEYVVKTEKLGESFPFTISQTVYDAAFADVMKMFYLQRCGSELSAERAGAFAHAACHTGPATVYDTGAKLEVSGGWHDAGDYGRYVVAGAKAAADLMLAYQVNPTAFAAATASSVPAVLEEVRYELEWMLKMQDAASGGVYHKVTTKNFAGEVMPDTVTEELVLAPISTSATADFAAVLAMASSVYRMYDAAFADRCLAAAEKAFAYTLKNPSVPFTNPEDIVTGEYGDSTTRDERAWAAAELLKATGKQEYNEYLIQAYNELIPAGFGWASVGSYAAYAYLTAKQETTDTALRAKLLESFTDEAQKVLEYAKADGYLISLGQSYRWGSNMTVANNAMQLLLADTLAPDAAYRQTAQNHLNYLLGANCLSYCYVTGYGAQSPTHTHHRPSIAVGQTMPGMLVGGPNSALEDPYARAVLSELPPAQCYADNTQSYSTNEVTIYWNSPLAFLLSYCAKAY